MTVRVQYTVVAFERTFAAVDAAVFISMPLLTPCYCRCLLIIFFSFFAARALLFTLFFFFFRYAERHGRPG